MTTSTQPEPMQARAYREFYIACYAPEWLFGRYRSRLTPRRAAKVAALPCKGSGDVTPYCAQCPHCAIDWLREEPYA